MASKTGFDTGVVAAVVHIDDIAQSFHLALFLNGRCPQTVRSSVSGLSIIYTILVWFATGNWKKLYIPAAFLPILLVLGRRLHGKLVATVHFPGARRGPLPNCNERCGLRTGPAGAPTGRCSARGFLSLFTQPRARQPLAQPLERPSITYLESLQKEMSQGSLSCSSARMIPISSMRLLVVSASPPEISLRTPLYSRIAPQPPGPGLPLHAPSVVYRDLFHKNAPYSHKLITDSIIIEKTRRPCKWQQSGPCRNAGDKNEALCANNAVFFIQYSQSTMAKLDNTTHKRYYLE